METYYAISYDKNAGGQHKFFVEIKKDKIEGTWILGEAQFFNTLGDTISRARNLLPRVGFKHTLYIHEWNPKMFMSTKIVAVI